MDAGDCKFLLVSDVIIVVEQEVLGLGEVEEHVTLALEDITIHQNKRFALVVMEVDMDQTNNFILRIFSNLNRFHC